MAEIVRGQQAPSEAAVRTVAASLVPPQDLDRVVELALEDLANLHEGNVSRYRLRLSEYRAWRPMQQGGGHDDNDYAIWKRWNNRYWPALYLLNKSGELCYRHFGEGRYRETEMRIRQLLAEKGG